MLFESRASAGAAYDDTPSWATSAWKSTSSVGVAPQVGPDKPSDPASAPAPCVAASPPVSCAPASCLAAVKPSHASPEAPQIAAAQAQRRTVVPAWLLSEHARRFIAFTVPWKSRGATTAEKSRLSADRAPDGSSRALARDSRARA